MTNTTTVFGNIPSRTIKDSIINRGQRDSVKGVRFPLFDTTNSAGGIFGQITGISRTRSEIDQLLGTGGDERLMLPNFGLNFEQYLFEPMTEEIKINIKRDVVTAMSEYIPDAKIQGIDITSLDDTSGYGIPGFKIKLKVFSLEFQAGTDITVYHRP